MPWSHGHTENHQELFVNRRPKRGTSGLIAFLVRLMSAQEVAQNLGISKSSVQRLIKTGQITSLKIGSCRRVSEQALINYVAQLESQFKQELREAIS